MIRETSSPKPGVRDAATVILIREHHTSPFEIFLMRRHRKQSFMGGAFVFPGGAQDDNDRAMDADGAVHNSELKRSLKRLTESGIPQATARGLFVTAIRETYEEAGVLFAKYKKTVPDKEGFRPAKQALLRKQLHAGAMTLITLAETEEIVFTPECLIPYARWITPDIENKRFDTVFFIAKTPHNQAPSHDNLELVESMWISPEEALIRNKEKKILLMPPTLKTLEELRDFTSIDRLFIAVARKKIVPILPQAISTGKNFGVKLPHDPEYTIEAYKQDARFDEPSRIMMIDGKWTTVFAEKE